MPQIPMSEKALQELHSVAEWYRTAKVKKNSNMSKCVDEHRFWKWRRLIEELDLYQEDNGFGRLRISGYVNIEKEPGLVNYFVPFKTAHVGGESYGSETTCALPRENSLNVTGLDCLLTAVPEPKKE